MKFLICLVLAAVATTTTYGQAPAVSSGRPNELLDDLHLLADILTDKQHTTVVDDTHYLRDD